MSLNLSRSNPTFEISLSSVFDGAFKSRSDSFKRQLRKRITNPDFKSAFGREVVKEIVNNTLQGRMANGKKLTGKDAKYSQSYKDSLEFKIYKSGTSQVNLKLTGEMLASVDSKNGTDKVTIFLRDKLNKDKAHGHMTGFNGKTNKRRIFLGLPIEDQEKLMRNLLPNFSRNDELISLAGSGATTIQGPSLNIGQSRTSLSSDLFSSIAMNPSLFGGNNGQS